MAMIYQQFVLIQEDPSLSDQTKRTGFRSGLERVIGVLKGEGFTILENNNHISGLPTSLLVGKAVQEQKPLPPVKERFYGLVQENGGLPYRSGNWYSEK